MNPLYPFWAFLRGERNFFAHPSFLSPLMSPKLFSLPRTQAKAHKISKQKKRQKIREKGRAKHQRRRFLRCCREKGKGRFYLLCSQKGTPFPKASQEVQFPKILGFFLDVFVASMKLGYSQGK